MFHVDPADFQPRELAALLRSVAEFIHANRRMPSFSDIAKLISVPMLITARQGAEGFRIQLEYINTVVDFIDHTDRIPLLEELPGPRFDGS